MSHFSISSLIQNFEIYSSEIVGIYFILAKLNQDIQSFQNAENYFNECIEIYQSLSVKNPKIYLPYLARTQINLALMYQENISEREKSILLLHEAIETLERFDKKEFEEALQSAYEILEKWNIEP